MPPRNRFAAKRPNPAFLADTLMENITGVEHDETRWKAPPTLKKELRDRHVVIVTPSSSVAGDPAPAGGVNGRA
jgi:hypothetical protein